MLTQAKRMMILDTGKELLHPIAIAQMMPQIFCSLIYHCRPCLESDSNIQEYYLSLEDMLSHFLLNLDWCISTVMDDNDY